MKVILNLNVTRERRVELDVIGESYLVVRWLNAQFRPDRDKSDKSTKFGTQFAYTLPNDIRRGAHVNLLMLPF